MRPAFLSLDQLTVRRLLVQTLDEHDPNDDDSEARYTSKITQLAQNSQDERLWKLTLEIRVRPKRGQSPPPYRIDVDMIGLFSVQPSALKNADLPRLIGVNGASMLYSAAREHVFMATSRGAWGPVQLPAVTFSDLKFEPVPSSETSQR